MVPPLVTQLEFARRQSSPNRRLVCTRQVNNAGRNDTHFLHENMVELDKWTDQPVPWGQVRTQPSPAARCASVMVIGGENLGDPEKS